MRAPPATGPRCLPRRCLSPPVRPRPPRLPSPPRGANPLPSLRPSSSRSEPSEEEEEAAPSPRVRRRGASSSSPATSSYAGADPRRPPVTAPMRRPARPSSEDGESSSSLSGFRRRRGASSLEAESLPWLNTPYVASSRLPAVRWRFIVVATPRGCSSGDSGRRQGRAAGHTRITTVAGVQGEEDGGTWAATAEVCTWRVKGCVTADDAKSANSSNLTLDFPKQRYTLHARKNAGQSPRVSVTNKDVCAGGVLST